MDNEKFALIVEGRVIETINADERKNYPGEMPWIACNKQVEPGWLYNGRTFVQPESVSLQNEKQEALSLIDTIVYELLNPAKGKESEYVIVDQSLAKWFKAQTDGEKSVIPSVIQSWADLNNLTVNDAAKQIAEASAHDDDHTITVRNTRLLVKKQIRESKSFEELAVNRDDGVQSLAKLKQHDE